MAKSTKASSSKPTKKEVTKPAKTPAAASKTKSGPAKTTATAKSGKATTVKGKSSAKAVPEKPKTKSEIYVALMEATHLERKQVVEFLEALKNLILSEIGRKGPGVVSLPGLVKFERKEKPATKEHTKPDPFNPGQMMTVKAKPASIKVKVTPLKDLKDAVNA